MATQATQPSRPAIPIAAITDEFSRDLDVALQAMASVGMTGAELRVIGDKNIIELNDAEVDCVTAAVASHGMRVISIASPLLKCVLPDAPAIDGRIQQDVFGSAYTIADQPRLTERGLEIARRTGAGIIRVFSYWRTIDPGRCFERVVAALGELGDRASSQGLVIGLENEAACNVGTGDETARVMAALNHPAVKVVWDPANAAILGEKPFPDGYVTLSPNWIGHVHAKDCRVHDHKPEWGLLGEMGIDWAGQIDALQRAGYPGWISLETHWQGPGGNKLEGSLQCGRKLRDLVAIS